MANYRVTWLVHLRQVIEADTVYEARSEATRIETAARGREGVAELARTSEDASVVWNTIEPLS